jgi:hypothetical protein
MLERSEGFADLTKHHIQVIKGICPHVSGRSFYVGSIQRICLFSDDFCSDSTLILTAVKQCTDIGAKPHVFVEYFMFVLTLTDGLLCAQFIYPTLVLVSGDRD